MIDRNGQRAIGISMNGNRLDKKMSVVLVAGILLACVCALAILLWKNGAFLPQWISWENRTILDHVQAYQVVLKKKKARVIQNDEVIWESPENIKVQDVVLCDIDRDMQKELIVLCWKVGRYGKRMPFWIAEDEKSWSQHLFVYKYHEKEIRPKWMSSYIGQDVAKMQDNGKETPYTRLWLTDLKGNTSSWMWDSWGFVKEESEISFVALGDNIIHEPIYRYGLQQEEGFSFLYQNIKNIVSDADVSIINQETPLTENPAMYGDYPRFWTPVEVGEAIVEAGFDVVTCATNHALDRGGEGADFTKSFFEKNGITCLGIQTQNEMEYQPYKIIARNGVKFALLNYTYGTNGIEASASNPYVVHRLGNKEQICYDIEMAKSEADFVIVFVHWGTENSEEISDFQQKWAQIFLDSKVDVVIGTHPHVLQSYEIMTDNGGHRMLVYYSLGNYISAQSEKVCIKGGMAKFSIGLTKEGYQITEYDLQPLEIAWHNGGKYVVTIQEEMSK